MPVTSSIFREGEGDGYRTIPTITWLYLTVSLKRDTDPGGRRFKSCPRYEKNPVSQRKVAEIPGFVLPKMARGARKRATYFRFPPSITVRSHRVNDLHSRAVPQMR